MCRFGQWDFMCTLSPNHNVHGENGVYQRWTTYALKSKSVSEMYFPVILMSKFNDLVNSKKTQSLWKNGCRQKCLDKSLPSQSSDSFEEFADNLQLSLDKISNQNAFLTVVLANFIPKSSNWYKHDKTTYKGSKIVAITSQFGL